MDISERRIERNLYTLKYESFPEKFDINKSMYIVDSSSKRIMITTFVEIHYLVL